ncbi:hypothetical protein H8788_05485 [Parabacteroides faecis]|uniref:hypothetical protein n=1 Tax=Parabacteroides TaxID=375288 RepID=UPI000EFFAD5E|nr:MULTISPECIES: hypothetical protein [Parabacteroides]MBC8617182.1 hypothetical protein [Parabacteroides faecis]RHS01129.1 hypothetical protein DWW23_01280 [Parabacteroides sp. AF14-59]
MKIKKDWYFKVVAGFLPIIILFLLEGGLRMIDFGNDLSLFIQDKKQPYLLHLNEKVSLRYFLQEKNATNGNIERFLKKKPQDVVRIFVQGESTAVGFPYFHNGAFPRMLDYRLHKDFPDINLELINLSMTALNSYAVYDFADEIIAQHPDAVIINAGHNEYYGALGIGSTGTLGSEITIARLGVELRKTKVGQLLSKILAAFFPDGNKTDYDHTLMERMVKKQEIPLESDLYKGGIKQYEKNLDETLAKYEKVGIRVFLTNTVCNLKDQKPFISVDGPDSLNASYCFYQADLAYKRGDKKKAKEQYMQAKELDALRFRAPKEINEITERLARKYKNVVFVDVERMFEGYASDSIIGKELMLEHLHPNLKGHFLISEALVKSFKQSSFLYANNAKQTDVEVEFKELPLTAVDSLCGEYATLLLKEGWPFNETIAPDDKKDKSLEEALAGGLAVNTIKWEVAMYKLLKAFVAKGDLSRAIKVGEAFILEYPYEYVMYEQIVNLCIDAKEYNKGIRYATRAYKLKKEPVMARQLAILYMKSDMPEKALPFLDILITANGRIDFRPMKEIAQKIVSCKKILAEEPGNVELKQEIFVLYSKIGNREAAAKYGNI